MPSFLANISLRVVGIIVAVIAAVLIVGFTVKSCDKRRAQAAQSRLERAQGDAQANSAADAVNTISRSGEAQAASEELTRKNEQEIRNAKGAGDAVDPAVRDAGIRSLCRRAAYRDSERCRLLKPNP
jgi:flagellar biosynthesis/type III secretory pathway M-ring protein FliF/YscJ